MTVTHCMRIDIIVLTPEVIFHRRGHLDEIQSCGSLHQFLEKYHSQYGPIISFHFGPQVCLSIASGKLFQEHAAHFDRPGRFKDSSLLQKLYQ